MRIKRWLIAIAALAALVGPSSEAAASASQPVLRLRDTTPTTPASIAIGGGLAFTGAVIIGPHGTLVHRLNAYQTAVYVQSWFADTYFGRPAHESPPADLPVYEVDATGYWGTGASLETRASYYASNGKEAWIAFPNQLPVGSRPSAPPGVVTGWFVAPPRVIETFAGHGTLVPTGGTQTGPTGTTATTPAPSTTVAPKPASSSSHKSSRSALLWIAIVLAAGAIASVILSARRGRAKQAPTIDA